MAEWQNSGAVKMNECCCFLLKKITPIFIITSVLYFKNIDVVAQSSPIKNDYQTFLYYYLENGKKVPLKFKMEDQK